MSETELTPEEREAVAIGDYKYGFHDEVTSVFPTRRGLDPDVVREISAHKSEPEWMLDFRLKSYEHFMKRPMPQWGANLSTIDFDNIYYYLKPVDEQAKSWDDLPDGMRETWDKLGIPEAEK
jgi:Fe-S cluster assembly protein SufB